MNFFEPRNPRFRGGVSGSGSEGLVRGFFPLS
jgi:hypothetical protein